MPKPIKPILFVVVVLVSLVIILGATLLVGWILTLLLPFTLFEGSLLGMLAMIVLGAIIYLVGRAGPPPFDEDLFDEEEDYDDELSWETLISPLRFAPTESERTWENYLRFQLSGILYSEFLDSPGVLPGTMNDDQVKELCIRLADAGVAALKARKPPVRNLRLTKAVLAQELRKLGQMPYDDEILEVAATTINMLLREEFETFARVIEEGLWDEIAEVG